MRHMFIVLLCGLTLSATAHAQSDAERLRMVFDGFGFEGGFVLASFEGDSVLRVHPERCGTGFIPASTFKIPNSCIALEEGVIGGVHDTLRWDGRMYPIRSWEQDQDMASAFQRSCVWFYQELARRIGEERMRSWIRKLDYGNKNIDGGIDMFWLDGELRITPEQQITFLRELFTEALPFRPEVMAQVRELMVIERDQSHALYGKTGWGTIEGKDYGWLVGAVETGGKTWLYALLLITNKADPHTFPAKRHEVLRALLREAGLLPM